mmetsp:Transcript_66665/g.194952  ORF Transcript_66665/g.194952 Transcript_66665/m.194952 type:complete len:232 (-) Transcript_66665:18-713(-)
MAGRLEGECVGPERAADFQWVARRVIKREVLAIKGSCTIRRLRRVQLQLGTSATRWQRGGVQGHAPGVLAIAPWVVSFTVRAHRVSPNQALLSGAARVFGRIARLAFAFTLRKRAGREKCFGITCSLPPIVMVGSRGVIVQVVDVQRAAHEADPVDLRLWDSKPSLVTRRPRAEISASNRTLPAPDKLVWGPRMNHASTTDGSEEAPDKSTVKHPLSSPPEAARNHLGIGS